MFVLARRTNESIVIEPNIVITVVNISGGQVKLGIAAPKDVRIVREEIWQAPETEEGAVIEELLRVALSRQEGT